MMGVGANMEGHSSKFQAHVRAQNKCYWASLQFAPHRADPFSEAIGPHHQHTIVLKIHFILEIAQFFLSKLLCLRSRVLVFSY
jgi:hypothetical protein